MAVIKGRAKCIPADREAIFLPFQSRWIKDTSRLKLMEKARQIGLSWSTAYATSERAAAQGARYDEWISSRDEIQARLFIEDCKLWAKVMDLAARDLGEVVIDIEKRLSAYVLQFASGRRIHSMSSNPDAQAGKRGSRVLDEFALQAEQRKMWAIAYPGITWGGVLELISTHRGSHSFFNHLVQEARHGGNPKRISLHRVTLQDALDQGFLYKLQHALPADADAADGAAFGVAQELAFTPAPQLKQRDVAQRCAHIEVGQGAALRVLVPRARQLAVVAAVDAVAHRGAEFLGNRTVVLDRQVADAAPRIEPVGRDDGLRGAHVDARRAAAAMRVEPLGERQRQVEVDLAQKEHRTRLAVQRERVLAAPAQTAARGQLHLEHRCRVGEHAMPERPHRLRDAIGQRLQPLAQHLVIVAAPGVDRHRGLLGRAQPLPFDGLPVAIGRLGW